MFIIIQWAHFIIQPESSIKEQESKPSPVDTLESPSIGPPKPPRRRGGSNTAATAATQQEKVGNEALPQRQTNMTLL